ncbi:BTAD domain-containing putative transcriptional regulator [Streptomyces sp. 71268]|uniref:AfsR/SARP family transcriptional regulator n=1 Tax=Streptomyces sp. 71268 TaxID=3002640 RepID=UPI0023F9E262|nr:AfsR/SARP family transcriptional regulator [Streptomyces sp. 71268]WEV27993.1 BTAD domain-containing putative transcriptional regulator [Streptomyces sp. 71268]
MKDGALPDAGTPDTEPTALRIGVLGPMEVRERGENRTPSAPMARRALAVLLIHANRLVTTSALIEELWEDEPPRLARKTVQTYVYQLRRALQSASGPSNRLETCPNGYRINLLVDELDLWEFERRVTQARRALGKGDALNVVATLRSALALWRGDPFAGLEAGPVLAARITQISEARISALELRIEAELQLGRHRSLLGELRQLTAAHPVHEEFTAQLMRAAYRADQRSMALDAFTRLRRNLVEDLGIDPSERLQKLQWDVLNETLEPDQPAARAEPVALTTPATVPTRPEPAPLAPAGAAPAAALAAHPAAGHRPPAQLPVDTADFTGRRAELARLEELAQPAAGARSAPRIVTVLGGAGAGKTALAVHAAHRLRELFPDGQLYARLHDDDDRPVRPACVLRALLRDLGHPVVDLPDDTEELGRIFRNWSAERRLLVLLDDATSADQVAPLLPGGPGSTVLVTSRVRLPGLPGAATVELGPMETDEAAELFASLAGRHRVGADSAVARQVVRLTGNLPLAVRAAGEKLAARPMWSVTDLAARLAEEDHRIAQLRTGSFDVLARLASACARLDQTAYEALTLLSAAGGEPFTIARAATLLGVDAWSAEMLVGQLLDHCVAEMWHEGPDAVPLFRIPVLTRLSVPVHAPATAALHVLPGARERAVPAAAGTSA